MKMTMKKKPTIYIWPFRTTRTGPWRVSLVVDEPAVVVGLPHRCETRSGIIRWAKRFIQAIKEGEIE